MTLLGLQKFDNSTLGDSLAHMVAGAVLIIPFMVLKDPVGGFITGFLMGVYREVDQYRRLAQRKGLDALNLLDRLTDSVGTGIGTALCVWLGMKWL